MLIAIIILAVFTATAVILVQKKVNAGLIATVAIFAGAFLLRLVLGYFLKGFDFDINTFKSWGAHVNEVGFQQTYQNPDYFLDYPPGYLYVLFILEKIRNLFGMASSSDFYTLIIKLPSIITDLACGWVIFKVAKRFKNESIALVAAAIYLFCPAVIVNSAQWGQVDSFCLLFFLFSVLCLYREKHIASALLFGVALACKPQMLIFVPIYLFVMLKRKQILKLILCMVLALSVILIIAKPFTVGFDYSWLLEKYFSTMGSYPYYSVNAYNIWVLFGMNWDELPAGGFQNIVLSLAGPLLATVLCGVLLLRSKKKEAIFAAPVVLMMTVYIFTVMMHERYLYPAMIFLLLLYVVNRDKRFLRAFLLVSGGHFLNATHVLNYFNFPKDTWTRVISLIQVIAYIYTIYVIYQVFIAESPHKMLSNEEKLIPEMPLANGDHNFHKADWILMCSITLLYGVIAFWGIGTNQMPETAWSPEQGESVMLESKRPVDTMAYLAGLLPDANHYRAKVRGKMQVEYSVDGEVWQDYGVIEDTGLYEWKLVTLQEPVHFVKLTALDENLVLQEVGLRDRYGVRYESLKSISGDATGLMDEQEMVPLYPSYKNSMYFDEIYHARTAYENVLGLEIYENTHPPLGKLLISLGIRCFGMNPLGWRFMGTFFGILMLPAFYFLLKKTLGTTFFCTLGVLLFSFDFMHYSQTRIATIDTYAVFFMILMFGAMAVFVNMDLRQASIKQILPPLCLSGIFMGLGIASKWTAAYCAIGLAALYFGKWVTAYILSKKESDIETRDLLKKAIKVSVACLGIFIVVPFIIYFACFLPMLLLSHNRDKILYAFVNYQTTMFSYHSELVAEHFFASPWFEWPLNIRPIWFYINSDFGVPGKIETISSMGNPLLWWACIPAMIYAFVESIRHKEGVFVFATVGFTAAYLPWILISRITFIYHYFTAVPFLILALCAVIKKLSEKPWMKNRYSLGSGGISIQRSTVLISSFVLMNLALFVIFFPVISGVPVEKSYVQALEWFPTWYFS